MIERNGLFQVNILVLSFYGINFVCICRIGCFLTKESKVQLTAVNEMQEGVRKISHRHPAVAIVKHTDIDGFHKTRHC